ncbi:relaxase domain-containing protein [Streptomyces sp. NPDC048551]|uniref:relaxase domain-containing protein n=1 Tax=Streptomyces sp. NPDC048551 TaxID=3155758 RepID=UPI0034339153
MERRLTVTGVDILFRPHPTINLPREPGTRRAARRMRRRPPEIERVLEWIEDHVTVSRCAKDGVYRLRPSGGQAAARFRHYESRAGMPLLHDDLLLSIKGQRPGGKWGSAHSEFLLGKTVAAAALYNELLAAEVCQWLRLATEPSTAADDNGEPTFASAVPEQARTKMNQIAARKIRPYAQLRQWWKSNAILSSGVASYVITSLFEHARATAVDVTWPCS